MTTINTPTILDFAQLFTGLICLFSAIKMALKFSESNFDSVKLLVEIYLATMICFTFGLYNIGTFIQKINGASQNSFFEIIEKTIPIAQSILAIILVLLCELISNQVAQIKELDEEVQAYKSGDVELRTRIEKLNQQLKQCKSTSKEANSAPTVLSDSLQLPTMPLSATRSKTLCELQNSKIKRQYPKEATM